MRDSERIASWKYDAGWIGFPFSDDIPALLVSWMSMVNDSMSISMSTGPGLSLFFRAQVGESSIG